ncbi:MAG TPA: alpha/beta hydrolase [Humibacillus xanthopallidus]|nr:alpha/beta hydrolase [Humibacillus xanthopallidus]
MKRSSSWDMPLRTRLVARAVARERGSISSIDARDIPRMREWTAPARAPYSWITGRVRRDVTIGTTAFHARDGHAVAVRTYRPVGAGAGPLPVLVWFHGGGWVLGNTESYDPVCSALAHGAGVLVVSVDYRLAPEFRAPQAALDCVDAVRWVAAAGSGLGARPDGIGVAGDSAGANLAAVVTQVVRSEGGAQITHQGLVYPAVDATMSQPSVAEHAHGAVLTRADMETFLAHYLGDGPDALDRHDPLVSPLYAADLAGLPPALVQTADLDPLRDDGAAYARALREAGVEVTLTNYPRVPHGFLSFPGATAARWAPCDELISWVARHAHRPRVG